MTNLKDKKVLGETIMDKYMETIPENIRGYVPSFRSLYEKLSEAVHTATEDAELFESVQRDVEKHFDIRRVHDLDNVKTKAGKVDEKSASG
jgi:hypothetical protein